MMAQNSPIPPSDVEYHYQLRDSRGAAALRLGYREAVTVLPDGTSKVFKQYEYIALGNGCLITTSTLAAGKVELAVCGHCRYPPPPAWWWLGCRKPERPSLGIFARESGDSCAGCSRFVCKRHSHVVADGSVRCISCARRFWWRALLHSVLYGPVREDR